MERTRRLMRESEESLPTIFVGLRNSGSTISFYWLRKFKYGEIPDPSVNRVEELYTYLTGKPVLEQSA